MPPPSTSSTNPSSPGKSASEAPSKAGYPPEVTEDIRDIYQRLGELKKEQKDMTKKFETQIEQQNVSTVVASAPVVLPPSPDMARRRISEAKVVQVTAELNKDIKDEREVSKRLREKLKEAEQDILSLNASAAHWKAKAEQQQTALEGQVAAQPECREARLEDQLGSLQVRFNSLKKQHDGKVTELIELKKQLDGKHKEFFDLAGERGEWERKLQDCSKENRSIRQKMETFAKDVQVADAEHRRIAESCSLMVPGEFMRNIKSSEARNNFSQENAQLVNRNSELETECTLHEKFLSCLRQKGLGDVINEVWHEVSTSEACEDPVQRRLP